LTRKSNAGIVRQLRKSWHHAVIHFGRIVLLKKDKLSNSIIASSMCSRLDMMQFDQETAKEHTAVLRFFADTVAEAAVRIDDTELLHRVKHSLRVALGKLHRFDPHASDEPWVGNTLATIGQRIADLQHEPGAEGEPVRAHLSPTELIAGPDCGFHRARQPEAVGKGGSFL
jgi:hypothetical protein